MYPTGVCAHNARLGRKTRSRLHGNSGVQRSGRMGRRPRASKAGGIQTVKLQNLNAVTR